LPPQALAGPRVLLAPASALGVLLLALRLDGELQRDVPRRGLPAEALEALEALLLAELEVAADAVVRAPVQRVEPEPDEVPEGLELALAEDRRRALVARDEVGERILAEGLLA